MPGLSIGGGLFGRRPRSTGHQRRFGAGGILAFGVSTLSLLSKWGRACARGRGLRLQMDAGPWTSGDPARALAALGSRLQPAGAAVTAVWEAREVWMQHVVARAALGVAVATAASTLVLNVWAVPSINANLLPQVTELLARILQREVEVGRVLWLLPTGITGLTPLARLGPVAVGPGPVEGSSARLEAVDVSFFPLRSLLFGQLVLAAVGRQAEIHLVQSSNFSWFGYPEDSLPSARNFVPGLNSGGSGGSGTTPGSGSGGDAGAGGGQEPPPAPPPPLPPHQPPAAGGGAARQAAESSRPGALARVQTFLERMAQELLQHSGQEPLQGTEDCPSVLLMGLGGAGGVPLGPWGTTPPGSPAAGGTLFRQHLAEQGAGLQHASEAKSSGSMGSGGGSRESRAKPSASRQDSVDAINALNISVTGPGNNAVALQLPRREAEQPQQEQAAPPAGQAQEEAPPQRRKRKGRQSVRSLHQRGRGSEGPVAQEAVAPAAEHATDTAPSQPAALEAAPAATALQDHLQPISVVPSGRLYTSSVDFGVKALLAKPKVSVVVEAPAAAVTAVAASVADSPTPAAVEPTAPKSIEQQQRRLPLSQAARLINALPAVTQAPARSAAPEEPAVVESEREPGTLSPAAVSINSVPGLVAPSGAISAAINGSGYDAFGKAVVDPSTLRRKGGSAALPWAQTRPPVRLTPASSKGSPAEQAVCQPEAEAATPAAASKGGAEEDPLAGSSTSTEGAALLEASIDGLPVLPPLPTALKSLPKVRLMHPGYFTSIEGPSYIPAPPEALAERRKRGFLNLIKSGLQAGLSQLQMPTVAVGTISIQGATLHAHIHGEQRPRTFENVSAVVDLGRNYETLALDIHALPHQRHSSEKKNTMLSPHANRNLRHVTGVAAMEAYNQEQPADAAAVAAPAADSATEPGGGKLRVLVRATDMQADTSKGLWPQLLISVAGQNLHAPLIERIVELPMDIHAGRANGELHIRSHDAASWRYPEFTGRVEVRGADFHFWDATDDIRAADMDLVFERDRLYLHNTTGNFGAVPMSVTGDLGLDPDLGHYRLTALVPGVEINQLRATLGVRPMPFPLAGAVQGTLHVSGPLEKPVFSGTAMVVRPSAEMLADCEPSDALAAVLAGPGAAGAYDKLPFKDAKVVFSLDTKTETMSLHAVTAEPLGGGHLQGYGKLWVAPSAELDPRAVSISAEGKGLPMEALAQYYLPPGASLPPGVVLGQASLTASMRGSHMEPTIHISYQLPDAPASGSVQFSRESILCNIASPYADLISSVLVRPPSFEAIKAAITQEQAAALAKPNIAGGNADVTFKGLDLVPLVSDQAALQQLAQQSGQPVRLRVNGCAKLAGSVEQPADSGSSWVLGGTLGLENIRLNQLKLFRSLAGNMQVSEGGLKVQARGLRPDESLDLDLTFPLRPIPVTASTSELRGEVDGAVADAPGAALPPAPAKLSGGGGGLLLRCGQLHMAANIDTDGSQVDFKVQNVKLDELELASLRGDLQEVSASLNFASQTGRGKLSLHCPRYSGLQGESLSGGLRWERDVVRLEKVVLQQNSSRYEVAGEYVVPPTIPLPTSSADLSRQKETAAQPAAATGRWRIQVSVPAAEMAELLPAARLLQNATSLAPSDYERAKATFLSEVKEASIRAAHELNAQLQRVAEELRPPADAVPSGAGGAADVLLGATNSGAALVQLPGLQDARGQWSGSIQAYGGGNGATSCEFDVRGQSWRWGAYGLDSIVANGSGHSEEGLQLQELVLKAGDAKLLVRGSLLGERQDATVLLTDFPVATLRPFFRAVPALEHTSPAVAAPSSSPMSSPYPLGLVANMLGTATKGLQQGADADSPINGMLYVSGNVGGSRDQPAGEVAVRLYDAAVGPTRLAQAQASARLSENQQLTFNVDIVPAESHRQSGHVKIVGVVPLSALDLDAGEDAASSGSAGAESARGQRDPSQPLDVRLSVRDSGMSILTSMTPDFRWRQGTAEVVLRVSGMLHHPTVVGSASISKASIDCPFLRFPLTIVTADVQCAEGLLTVDALDARVGRKGYIKVRGGLPLFQGGKGNNLPGKLTAEVQGLELRVRNMYTGHYDASLTVTQSLERPTVGGSMRFSRGTMLLVPQGGPDAGGAAAAELGLGGGASSLGDAQQEPVGAVTKAFSVLWPSGDGSHLAQQFEAVVRREVEAMEAIVEDAGQHNVTLDRLRIQLGPDLRAVYPLVMNFSAAGSLEVSGPAQPDQVAVSGVVRLLSGDVNLVATQLSMDREHPNTITFIPQPGGGLDPTVDMVMTGGDLRMSIQGRASEWQDHLVLQYLGGRTSAEGTEQLDAAEAARIFEDKLKAALLADDGQLALTRLAGTTVTTLMPKIETQGQVGTTTWRLVSAPAIPGLLDPNSVDPANLLGSITMGTEVEVQFGRKLQVALVRKLRETDVATQWTASYNLNSKLRMQFNITSAPPYPKTLMFQFQSNGGPPSPN